MEALPFFILVFAGWMNRKQQKVVEYLRAENLVVKSTSANDASDSRTHNGERSVESQGRGPKAASRARLYRITGHASALA